MHSHSRTARIFNRFAEVQLWIAAAALTLMMLVIVLDVALRYFLNNPLRGSYDLVQITLVIMVLFGLPKVFIDGAHIAIDLIDHVLPGTGRRLLGRIAAVLSIVALGFVLYAMVGPFWSAFQYGDRSLELNLPQWIVWLLALVGVAGSILAAIASLMAPVKSDHSSEIIE